jgi:hypothetical protein
MRAWIMMDKELIVDLGINLAADLIASLTGFCAREKLEQIRRALDEKHVMRKVAGALCTGLTELEQAEHADGGSLAIEPEFFQRPLVRRAFIGWVIGDKSARETLIQECRAQYSAHDLSIIERNLDLAYDILQATLDESLDPALRARFARLEDGVSQIGDELSDSTRALLADGARTREIVTDVGENVVRRVELTLSYGESIRRRFSRCEICCRSMRQD